MATYIARRWVATVASISAQYCSTAAPDRPPEQRGQDSADHGDHHRQSSREVPVATPPRLSSIAGSGSAPPPVMRPFQPVSRWLRQRLLDERPAGRQVQAVAAADPLFQGREGVTSTGRPDGLVAGRVPDQPRGGPAACGRARLTSRSRRRRCRPHGVPSAGGTAAAGQPRPAIMLRSRSGQRGPPRDVPAMIPRTPRSTRAGEPDAVAIAQVAPNPGIRVPRSGPRAAQ